MTRHDPDRPQTEGLSAVEFGQIILVIAIAAMVTAVAAYTAHLVFPA